MTLVECTAQRQQYVSRTVRFLVPYSQFCLRIHRATASTGMILRVITYRFRLLFRFVAHNSQPTRAPVLDRSPTTGPGERDCEVLVLDDSALSRALFWLNQALIRISLGSFLTRSSSARRIPPDVTCVVASTRASIEAVVHES